MATRACKVTLRKPIGINNFQGKSFRCFARGDTLPFYLEFRYTDGNPVDITGWRCIVAFTNSLSCSRPDVEILPWYWKLIFLSMTLRMVSLQVT